MKKKLKAVPNDRRPLMLRGVQIVFISAVVIITLLNFHMECSGSKERIEPQHKAVSVRCNYTDYKRNQQYHESQNGRSESSGKFRLQDAGRHC